MNRQAFSRWGSIGLAVASSFRFESVCEETSHPFVSGASGEFLIRSSSGNNNCDLLIVYDAKTRCPKYVVEKLIKSDADEVEDKARPPFHGEPSIMELFRVRCRYWLHYN